METFQRGGNAGSTLRTRTTPDHRQLHMSTVTDHRIGTGAEPS